MNDSKSNKKEATKGFAEDGVFEVPAISLNIGGTDEPNIEIEDFLHKNLEEDPDDFELEVKTANKLDRNINTSNLEEEDEDEQEEEDEGNSRNQYDDSKDTSKNKVDYSDYSDIALYALSLQKDGVIDLEAEISPEMSREDLHKLQINQFEKNKYNYLYNLGYNPELLKYTEYLLQGGDPGKVQDLQKNAKFSQLEVEDDSQKSLENRKTVILEMYKAKGLKSDRAFKLYQSLLEDDSDLEEAVEAQKFFKEIEEYELKRQANEKQIQEEENTRISRENTQKTRELIKQGNLAGVVISQHEAKSLEKALFDPSETIEYIDEKGRKKVAKVTKYQKVWEEINNDLGKQLLLAYLATSGDGFNKDSLISKADIQSENDILDAISNRKRGSRHRSTRNSSDDLSRFMP